VKLSDFVAAERSVVPLEASALPAAASILLERLERAGAIADVPRLRERVVEERPEDIVAMGERAFLLHYRTDAVRELVVALGTAREPICRQLADNDEQCARIVLLVVSPPRMAARYLQVVGAFARLFSDPVVVETVLEQANAEELAALAIFSSQQLPEQLVVRDIMTPRPRTVSPETLVRDAARDMVRAGVEGLPVVDEEGRLVGMLSERELLRHLLSSQLAGGGGSSRTESTGVTARRTVRDVMTRQVLCVSVEQPLAEVASLMSNKELDRVPVVHSGRLVGVLTRGDIVRKLIGS
jgi:CBS domain-containing protein/mannitol/fructose-specific phosphotransferase system IIA component (Ntr-type)